jgi:tetratricopeptide (TPR) repeat protein
VGLGRRSKRETGFEIMNTRILLATALGAILMVAGASGQNTSSRKKNSPRSKPSPVSKTRSRRVVAVPIGEAQLPAEQPTKTKSVQTSSESPVKPVVEPVDKSAAKLTEATGVPEKSSDKTADTKTSQAPNDTLSLRDQVDAAASGPERIRLQLKLVDQLLAAGKRPEAITELHLITSTDAFDPQGLYNTGNALARLGDSDEAINAYRKAIDQRKGKYSRALNNLGVVLLREGRWSEAYEAFLSALKLENFRYAEASYNLGRLYAGRGEPDLASREWRRALKVDPGHTAAAQALSRAGTEGSISIESPATKVRSVTIDNNEALVRSAEGNIGSSRSEWAPKAPTVDAVSYGFLQRARIAFESGNLEQAVDNYQRLISRMGGYFSPANLELSFALISLKRNDEAMANLLRVANRDGARYPISYYFLGRLYELKGDLKLAEEAFAKAVSAYPAKNGQFLLDLSRVRERQGDFKGALAAMEEYVALMEKQGQKPAWSDERLSALRQKLK